MHVFSCKNSSSLCAFCGSDNDFLQQQVIGSICIVCKKCKKVKRKYRKTVTGMTADKYFSAVCQDTGHPGNTQLRQFRYNE